MEKEESSYLYLLAEQQTNPDRWLPLRLLRYLCAVLERHRQQHPNVKHLPLVIPLIFYTGQAPYTYSTDCFDLFADHHDMARDLFMGPYHLVQLNQIPDDEIYTHR